MPDGMIRRSKRGRTMATAITTDIGPAIQHKRGALVVGYGPDPDRPNAPDIRRAMRRPHYARLYAKGQISVEERNCCDRYAILTEAMGGAKWVNGEHVGGGGNPAYRGHPTITQVQASARITTAHGALGGDASALLSLFVVQDIPITEMARRRKEREDVCKGRVLAAIARLAEHWGA